MSAPPPAIVLAAGDGGRLRPLTSTRPKPLVQVGGVPLILHTMSALDAAGVHEIVVVTGDRGSEVRAAVERLWGCSARITFVNNERYTGGNGDTLAHAAATLRRGAIVAMADHLPAPEMIARLLDAPRDEPSIAVDFGIEEAWVLAEATRVAIGPGMRVTAIGKGLEPFDGVDAGLFYLTPDVVPHLDDNPDLELTTVIRRFLQRPGGLAACDITGLPWWDVDTIADLAIAELRLDEWRARVG